MDRVVVIALAALLSGATDATAQTCRYRGTTAALLERPSPLDSVRIDLGGAVATLCYGRPSARGRAVIGVQDPYGAPWRLGANEPTTIHLPFPAEIGGVPVGPGAYSLAGSSAVSSDGSCTAGGSAAAASARRSFCRSR